MQIKQLSFLRKNLFFNQFKVVLKIDPFYIMLI
jgi:hypothetical protein